jgi:hypothetical protein
MSINGFSHENDHSATNYQVLVPSELKKKKKKKKKKQQQQQLKGKSFFSVGISPTSLRSWHKLLKLCDKARHYIKFEVGNGKDIFLWLDWWHPAGVVIEKCGYRVIYDACSHIDAKLWSVLCNGVWLWWPGR